MWVYLIIFEAGACLGSFFQLIIYRWPKQISIISPRSHCNHCGQTLNWWELIPIFSFIFLKGHCHHCAAKIPCNSLFNEIFLGSLALLAIHFGFNESILFWAPLLLCLLYFSLADCAFLAISLAQLYLSFLLLGSWQFYLGLPFHWLSAILFSLGLIGLSFILPNQLGSGDIHFIACCCLLLGSEIMLKAIWLASFFGLLCFIFLKFRLKETQKAVPFIPLISLGIFLVLLNLF